MPDMLVPLYKLPARPSDSFECESEAILIRPANTFEQTPVTDFIRAHFSQGWADETTSAFARQPVTCLIALTQNRVVGFATYESTRRGFFGPTGVDEAYRGKGIGKALLISAMWGLKDMGYAYGIIGGAGPTEFYAKGVNAIIIPDSVPGVYTNLIKRS